MAGILTGKVTGSCRQKINDEVANGDIGEVIGIFRKDQKMVMRVDFGDGQGHGISGGRLLAADTGICDYGT